MGRASRPRTGGRDCRNRQRIAILRNVEPPELQAAVFDEVASHDLRLGLKQVKRRPPRFGNRAEHVHNEGRREHQGEGIVCASTMALSRIEPTSRVTAAIDSTIGIS